MVVRNIARNKSRVVVAMVGAIVLQYAHHLRYGAAGVGGRLRGDTTLAPWITACALPISDSGAGTPRQLPEPALTAQRVEGVMKRA